MKYAVIAVAGRQFLVKEGDVFKVTRQDGALARVLFYRDDEQIKVGTPCLDDIKVGLEKAEDKKDKKVVVARFRAKSRHRRKIGHRQEVSVFKVTDILGGDKSTKKSAKSGDKKNSKDVTLEVKHEEGK